MKAVKEITPPISDAFLAKKEIVSTIENHPADTMLFENGLEELYWTKRKMIKLSDLLIRKTFSQDLSDTLEEYQVIMHRQLRRIDDIFFLLEITPDPKICEITKDIITEVSGKIEENGAGNKRDTDIISAVLKIENHWVSNIKMLSELARKLKAMRAGILIDEIQLETQMIIARFSYFSERKVMQTELTE